MSEKQANIRVEGEFEYTNKLVDVELAVDYLNKGYVYLTVGLADPIAIRVADAKELAAFIDKEAV